MAEERTKYQKEWDDYRNRSADGCLAVLIVFPIAAAAIVLAQMYETVADFLQKASFFIFLAIIGYSVFFSLRQQKWKCPRCGATFQGWRRHMPRFCVYCGLPKYYGSAYFYNTWGSDEGRSLAERVEKGDLKVNEG